MRSVLSVLVFCLLGLTPAQDAPASRRSEPSLLPHPSPLVCSRSSAEVYGQFPIHWDLSETGIAVPFYGNRYCPMSGDPVRPDAFFVHEHQGWEQRVYFCCQKCADDGKNAPGVWFPRAYQPDLELRKRDLSLSPLLVTPPEAVAPPEDPQELAIFQLRQLNYGSSTYFQGFMLSLGAIADAEFAANSILALARGDHPEAIPVVNSTCPVSGKPAAPDILAVHDGRILHFATWDALADYVRDPARYSEVVAAIEPLTPPPSTSPPEQTESPSSPDQE